MITMKDWQVSVPWQDERIGFVGENQVFRLEIGTDAPEGWEYKLDFKYASGRKNFLLLHHADGALWCMILREHLENGRVTAQIRAVKGEQEKHSNLFGLLVENSILASKAFERTAPSAFAQLEERLSALHLGTEAAASRAEGAAGQAADAADAAAQAAETAGQRAEAAADSAAAAVESGWQAEDSAVRAEDAAESAAADALRAGVQAERAEALTAKMPVVRGGNWWIYDPQKDMYIDSGQPAQGEKGDKGNVMYAAFSVAPGSGLLTMEYPDEYGGPEFRLNNGYLEVLVNG